MLICSLSVISTAKSSGNCCKNMNNTKEGSDLQQSLNPAPKSGLGFDLSPLQFFVFNL